MAIIDSQNVFMDGPVRASGVSRVVALTSLTLPGRMEAMPLRVSVTEAYDASELATLTLTLQQADSATGTDWADVPGSACTLMAAQLTAGARLPWRFLPEGVSKSFLRFSYTVTAQEDATISKGALFAALTREEDFPYVPAQRVGAR